MKVITHKSVSTRPSTIALLKSSLDLVEETIVKTLKSNFKETPLRTDELNQVIEIYQQLKSAIDTIEKNGTSGYEEESEIY